MLGHVSLSRDSPQEMGRDSEEDGDGGDDVDEVGDLAGDRRLDRLEAEATTGPSWESRPPRPRASRRPSRGRWRGSLCDPSPYGRRC